MATSYHDPEMVREYNRGFHDGYTRVAPDSEGGVGYTRAYIAGLEIRLEDEEALASGEVDVLTPDERRQVYGDESA